VREIRLKIVRSQVTHTETQSPFPGGDGNRLEQAARLVRRQSDKTSLAEIGAGDFTDG